MRRPRAVLLVSSLWCDANVQGGFVLDCSTRYQIVHATYDEGLPARVPLWLKYRGRWYVPAAVQATAPLCSCRIGVAVVASLSCRNAAELPLLTAGRALVVDVHVVRVDVVAEAVCLGCC